MSNSARSWDWIRLRDLAARCARVLRGTLRPLEKRARGTPDARCVRSPVCKSRKHTSVGTTVASLPSLSLSRFGGGTGRGRPAFRARWASGLLRALPGSDSSAWVRHRRSMLTSPLRLKRTATHRLDASDGHRDHTTWAGARGDTVGCISTPAAPRSVVVCARMAAHGALAMEEPALPPSPRAERCRVHRIPPRGS